MHGTVVVMHSSINHHQDADKYLVDDARIEKLTPQTKKGYGNKPWQDSSETFAFASSGY